MSTALLPTDSVVEARGSEETVTDLRLSARVAGLTDRGLVRPINEDQYLIASLGSAFRVQSSSVALPNGQQGPPLAAIYLVADGIGGANGGEHASALVVRCMQSFLAKELPSLLNSPNLTKDAVGVALQKVLRRIDGRMFAEAAAQPSLKGMGTTLTMALVCNSEISIVHVGDGRGYVLRDGVLQQLTRDHTLVQDLLEDGLLRPDEVETHSLRHVITNCLGGTTPGVSPDVIRFQPRPGDVFLLCTDGLTRMLDNAEIAAILRNSSDPEVNCKKLVDQANAAGGRDNTTVLVARCDA